MICARADTFKPAQAYNYLTLFVRLVHSPLRVTILGSLPTNIAAITLNSVSLYIIHHLERYNLSTHIFLPS